MQRQVFWLCPFELFNLVLHGDRGKEILFFLEKEWVLQIVARHYRYCIIYAVIARIRYHCRAIS